MTIRDKFLSLYRSIFAHRRLYAFNNLLFDMSLRGLGILNYGAGNITGEKYLVNKLLPSIVTTDRPVMFDVGANIGDYTSLLLERFPEAQIHAFEPHPKNYSRLLAKIKNGNVKFYNMGIGEHKGNLTLYDRADHNGSAHASLYKEVISDIHKQKYTEIDVSVETLDEIASKEGIRYIDFLKIDTEGNELSVLKGAAHLIKTHSIGCIHFEFNEMNVISRVYFHDFCSALYDYDFYRLLPNGLLPLGRTPLSTELFAYQNILAIPKSNRIRD